MARVTAYAESLGDSTSTSSTLATKVSVTFTPNANKTYAYLYSCGVQNNSTSGFAEVELNNTTDAVELYQITPRIVKDAADFMVRGGVAYESYGSSPGSKTIALQYNQQNTGTATIRNARLVVIELDADDKFVYNTDVFTSSASYSTVSQITFTPGSTGDYLILASGNYWSDGTGLIGNCRMYVNGSTYGAYSRSTTGGDHENTWATGFKLASASGAQDYRIELNSNGTNNTGMFHGYMVAFRLDKFGANYYQEDRGRSTYSTDTTYQTKTTLTQTPANVEHIVLAGFILDHASTSNSALGKLVETSTDILVSDEEPQSTSSSNKIAYFAAYRKTLAASSTSWTNQYATETSATVTGIYESWIAILQTADSATNVNANPTGVAGTGAVGTPSITGTAVVNPTGVAGTGSPGTVAVQISVAPAMTGLAATGGVGSLTITGTATVQPVGLAGTGQVGSPLITTDVVAAITGVAGAGQVGDPTVTISVDVIVNITGVFSSGAVGSLTVVGNANVLLTGLEAQGLVGGVTVDEGEAGGDGEAERFRGFLKNVGRFMNH